MHINRCLLNLYDPNIVIFKKIPRGLVILVGTIYGSISNILLRKILLFNA